MRALGDHSWILFAASHKSGEQTERSHKAFTAGSFLNDQTRVGSEPSDRSRSKILIWRFFCPWIHDIDSGPSLQRVSCVSGRFQNAKGNLAPQDAWSSDDLPAWHAPILDPGHCERPLPACVSVSGGLHVRRHRRLPLIRALCREVAHGDRPPKRGKWVNWSRLCPLHLQVLLPLDSRH